MTVSIAPTTRAAFDRSELRSTEVKAASPFSSGRQYTNKRTVEQAEADKREIAKLISVDPSKKNKKASGASDTFMTGSTQKLDEQKDMFIKILTKSLVCQDPSKPKDLDGMVQNFASFAQVEQAIETNKKLDRLINVRNLDNLDSLVGYIGKKVMGPGNLLDFKNTQDGSSYFYDLPEEVDPASVTVSIYDLMSNRVFFKKLSEEEATSGRHDVFWDGKTDTGTEVSPGVYRVVVQGMDAKKNSLEIPTYVSGVVKSIDRDENGEILANFGALSMPVAGLSRVMDQSTLFRQEAPEALQAAHQQGNTVLEDSQAPQRVDQSGTALGAPQDTSASSSSSSSLIDVIADSFTLDADF